MTRIESMVGEHVPLTFEEQRDAVTRAQAGDSAARLALVQTCVPVIGYACRRWANSHLPFEEKVSGAVEGILKAIPKYDVNRAKRKNFEMFALWYAFNGIRKVHIDYGFPSSPDGQKVNNFVFEYEQEHGYTPSPDKVVEETGLSLANVESRMRKGKALAAKHIASLDGIDLDSRIGTRLGSAVRERYLDPGAAASLRQVEDRAEVVSLLAHLSTDDRQIVWRRAQGDLFKDIASDLGISREWARLRYYQLLEELREKVSLD